eukprot:616038-Amphidinium_carterae.1
MLTWVCNTIGGKNTDDHVAFLHANSHQAPLLSQLASTLRQPGKGVTITEVWDCLLYTSPSPRDRG